MCQYDIYGSVIAEYVIQITIYISIKSHDHQNHTAVEMDLMTSDICFVKSEPETIPEEESQTSRGDALLQYGIVKQETEYASFVKSEPEIGHEHESSTSYCDTILQYGNVKQDTQDVSATEYDPVTLAAQKHAQEYGAYPEIYIIGYPDTKQECLVNMERIDQSREFDSSKSSTIGTRDLEPKQVTGKKSFSCPTCAYMCTYKSNMVCHIRTHTGEKPYACPKCNYTCNEKSKMVRHDRTHTGEKPFMCSECPYSCIQKKDLVNHSKNHTGEKPFSCSECSFRCKQKSYLVYHTRIHTGEKPFSCRECFYKCNRKSSLVLHAKTHTGE